MTCSRCGKPTKDVSLFCGKCNSKPLKILCVDDDESLRNVLARLLDALGCEVETVSTGWDALERVYRIPFDVVITDYDMDGMNGKELAKKVKLIRPGCPVVLLTGSRGKAKSAFAKMQGIDAVILKPATLETFRETLVLAIRKNRGEE